MYHPQSYLQKRFFHSLVVMGFTQFKTVGAKRHPPEQAGAKRQQAKSIARPESITAERATNSLSLGQEQTCSVGKCRLHNNLSNTVNKDI